MALQLAYWDKAGVRVYVNGLPYSGKGYFELRGGKAVLVAQGDFPSADVMNAVTDTLGIDATNWEQVVDAARSGPKAKRGRAPGTMAGSRKSSFGAPAPNEWTAEDGELLDPVFVKDPFRVPTTIHVDNREPAVMVDYLRRFNNLDVVVRALDTGDYEVPGKLVIERKTMDDFAASIVGEDKRLFWQTDRITEMNVYGVVLLEGNVYSATRMKLPAISGALSFLSVVQGVGTIPTLSPIHSAYMIAKLTRHVTDGLGYDLDLRQRKPKDPYSAAIFVLEGIPTVSYTIAKALLAEFGSVLGVASATLEQIRRVKGVGDAKAQLIHDTLKKNFGR